MNLQIMSNDEDLLDVLRTSGIFTDIKQVFSKESLIDDCIIISDEFFDYTEIEDFKKRDRQTVFYYLQSETYTGSLERSIKALCDSKGIHLLSNRHTNEQISKQISLLLEHDKTSKSNVITFFSTLGNIGTTATTLSVGDALTENTKAKVGVLLLNAWDHGTHQIDYKGEFIDHMKARLSSKELSKEDFLSSFHVIKNDSLYILGGNRSTKLERMYSKDEVNLLISMAKQTFDVVLIDAGAHFDNAMMVQSLAESDIRFFVLNQQPKAIDKFNRLYDELLYPLGYNRTDFLTLLNQYIDNTQLLTPKDISAELNMVNVSTIYPVEQAIYSEIDKKVLLQFDDPVYYESILKIVRTIGSHVGLELSEKVRNKKKKLFIFN